MFSTTPPRPRGARKCSPSMLSWITQSDITTSRAPAATSLPIARPEPPLWNMWQPVMVTSSVRSPTRRPSSLYPDLIDTQSAPALSEQARMRTRLLESTSTPSVLRAIFFWKVVIPSTSTSVQ